MHRKVTKVCASSRLCLHKFLAGLWWKPFALPWAEAEADRAPGAPPSMARLKSLEVINLHMGSSQVVLRPYTFSRLFPFT